MNKVIEQTINFKGVTASELFDIYVNPAKHSAIHNGAKTFISDKEGDNFSLLDGNLNGRNLLVLRDRMIVQSWRGNVWKDDDLDSVLTLTFHNTTNGAKIEMVHCCTPTQFQELWDEVYWKPLRKYLKK
jgi:activator of HSP90 ATPase